MIHSKVYIVDDDQDVRNAITLLMQTVGLEVETFESAQHFLDSFNKETIGCILLDVRMPGMSGIDLMQQLLNQPYSPPIIIISGHGDISMAVKAVKDGAYDFIEKPFNEQKLLDSIHKALELDIKNRGESSRLNQIIEHIEQLTPREKQVLNLVTKGLRNKVIAQNLHISPSTVEAHRAKVMEKMQAETLSDLMRMVILLEE